MINTEFLFFLATPQVFIVLAEDQASESLSRYYYGKTNAQFPKLWEYIVCNFLKLAQLYTQQSTFYCMPGLHALSLAQHTHVFLCGSFLFSSYKEPFTPHQCAD